jgi:hypothetical protein
MSKISPYLGRPNKKTPDTFYPNKKGMYRPKIISRYYPFKLPTFLYLPTVNSYARVIGRKSIPFCYRGDVSTAKSIIKAMERRPQIFDMNCVDPLGRSALIIAVENENRDMIEMLLETGIKIKDALLVAIRYRME